MTCSYCRYLNLDDERRCRRCGRPQNDMYASATAGALAAVPAAAQASCNSATAGTRPAARRAAAAPRQAMLFPGRGKVIPFDGIADPRRQDRSRRQIAPRRAPEGARATTNELQGSLESDRGSRGSQKSRHDS